MKLSDRLLIILPPGRAGYAQVSNAVPRCADCEKRLHSGNARTSESLSSTHIGRHYQALSFR